MAHAAHAFCVTPQEEQLAQQGVHPSSASASSTSGGAGGSSSGGEDGAAAVARLVHAACGPLQGAQLACCTPAQLAALAAALQRCRFKPLALLEAEAAVAAAAEALQARAGSGAGPGEEAGAGAGGEGKDEGGGAGPGGEALAKLKAALGGSVQVISAPAAAVSGEASGSGDAAAVTNGGPGAAVFGAGVPAASPAAGGFDGQEVYEALLLGGRLQRCADGEEVMAVIGPLASVSLLPGADVLRALEARVLDLAAQEVALGDAQAAQQHSTPAPAGDGAGDGAGAGGGCSPDAAASPAAPTATDAGSDCSSAGVLHEACLALFVMTALGRAPSARTLAAAQALLGPRMGRLTPSDFTQALWALACAQPAPSALAAAASAASAAGSATSTAWPASQPESAASTQVEGREAVDGGEQPSGSPRPRYTSLADIAQANSANAAARAAEEGGELASSSSSSSRVAGEGSSLDAAPSSTSASSTAPPHLPQPPAWLLQAHAAASEHLSRAPLPRPHDIAFQLASFERVAAAAVAAHAQPQGAQLAPPGTAAALRQGGAAAWLPPAELVDDVSVWLGRPHS